MLKIKNSTRINDRKSYNSFNSKLVIVSLSFYPFGVDAIVN